MLLSFPPEKPVGVNFRFLFLKSWSTPLASLFPVRPHLFPKYSQAKKQLLTGSKNKQTDKQQKPNKIFLTYSNTNFRENRSS